MIEATIKKLFVECGLGHVEGEIKPVSGGFMHRMYRVSADGKTYAVKHLNPSIMSRESAAGNFDRAEELEKRVEEAGVSICPALTFQGKKRQCVNQQYFYIFHWLEGQTTDWNHITKEQCQSVGNILGRIHSISVGVQSPTEIKAFGGLQECISGNQFSGSNDGSNVSPCENNLQLNLIEENENAEISAIPWQKYIEKATKQKSEIRDILSEHYDLLVYAESELNRARMNLPNMICISNEDMDPKNVMWVNGQPVVIDLECLDYGNPASHVLQLALQWSGITTCSLDLELTKAFFQGYLNAYDNGFRSFDTIFGMAYTWIEWLEYNIERTLGNSMDEAERTMGISEVKNTINRIRYIHEKEQEIKQMLKEL